MNILEVSNINKRFNNQEVLHDVSFNVKKGEVVCIIGSSGSGKSTLLRCLNLLEKADSGAIKYNGIDLMQANVNLNEIRSKVGMVFQNFNLFDNLNVIDNCTLAPRLVLKTDKTKREEQAIKYLEKVDMHRYSNQKVTTLSGGQKQRVAIARALCMNPDILLFDEPTSALDPESIEEVLKVMKELARQKMTMIIVTHEISFAKDIADRILFVADGIILEEGKPEDILFNPTHQKTKTFLQRFNNSV
ncbi:putative lysine transport system ATP-binding protein [Bacilli bacterium PM5-3]|nr:putative lysine transport system ATP-binding protein [Bacilli bacterium PM5-3]